MINRAVNHEAVSCRAFLEYRKTIRFMNVPTMLLVTTFLEMIFVLTNTSDQRSIALRTANENQPTCNLYVGGPIATGSLGSLRLLDWQPHSTM